MQLNVLRRDELPSSLAVAKKVSGNSKDSERVHPCFNQRRVRPPAANAMLRMSRYPSFASIRGWLIAEGALRKDHKQRELSSSLKMIKFNLP